MLNPYQVLIIFQEIVSISPSDAHDMRSNYPHEACENDDILGMFRKIEKIDLNSFVFFRFVFRIISYDTCRVLAHFRRHRLW